MTPYAKRLLKYAIANCPLRPVRKGKSKAQLLAEREQWAVNYLNCGIGEHWQQLQRQPNAVRRVVTTTDEDDGSC